VGDTADGEREEVEEGELMMVLLAGKLGPGLEAITRNCLGCGDILNTDLA